MKLKNIFQIIAIYLSIGFLVPFIFLLNAFAIEEPYSHPLMRVATFPAYLMPFLENRDFLKMLTLLVLGKQTANYAPIVILILIIFWFTFSILLTFMIRYIRSHYLRK
jgi:hypothetical protein